MSLRNPLRLSSFYLWNYSDVQGKGRVEDCFEVCYAVSPLYFRFLNAYYSALHESPASLSSFYHEDSNICRVKRLSGASTTTALFTGASEVPEAMAVCFPCPKFRVEVTFVAVVSAGNNTILVTTNGTFTPPRTISTDPISFTQTFALSHEESNVFIKAESLIVSTFVKADSGWEEANISEAERKAAAEAIAREEAARVESERLAQEAAARAEAERVAAEEAQRKAIEEAARRAAEIQAAREAEASLRAARQAEIEAAQRKAAEEAEAARLAAAAEEEEEARIAAEQAAFIAAQEEVARLAEVAKDPELTAEERRRLEQERPPASLIYDSGTWAGIVANRAPKTINVVAQQIHAEPTPVPKSRANPTSNKNVREPVSQYLFVVPSPSTDEALIKAVEPALRLCQGKVIRVIRPAEKRFCFVEMNSLHAACELVGFGSVTAKDGTVMTFEGTDFDGSQRPSKPKTETTGAPSSRRPPMNSNNNATTSIHTQNNNPNLHNSSQSTNAPSTAQVNSHENKQSRNGTATRPKQSKETDTQGGFLPVRRTTAPSGAKAVPAQRK